MMSDRISRLELPEMEPRLADYLGPRVARLNYLGELFKCVAHAPQVLLSFMRFTDALKDALPDPLAEVAVLTTATLMDNRYERNQHERLCVRLGLGRDWVAQVESLAPSEAPLMSESERAVQRYVLAAVRSRGLDCVSEFDALAALVPPSQAVAIPMLVGRYITHALVVNTLKLNAPVPSIWEDGFTGDGAPAKNTRAAAEGKTK